MMTSAVELARNSGAKHIGVNAEDASRTRMDYLIEFAEAAKKFRRSKIPYCDTLGYDGPLRFYDRVGEIAEKIKLPIELTAMVILEWLLQRLLPAPSSD